MISATLSTGVANPTLDFSLATQTLAESIWMGLSKAKEQLNDFYYLKSVDTAIENIEYVDSSIDSHYVDIMMYSNLDKIETFSRFEQDWDGNDAAPYSADAILFFRHVIKNLNKQPEISPTPADSLIMQYTAENGNIQYYNIGLVKVESVFIPGGDLSMAEEYVYINKPDPISIINSDMEKVYGAKKYSR